WLRWLILGQIQRVSVSEILSIPSGDIKTLHLISLKTDRMTHHNRRIWCYDKAWGDKRKKVNGLSQKANKGQATPAIVGEDENAS
ncbi:MAG TPA: hypothetical protein P5526_27530, partial [Anaerolineae bacterium]|nr:hypothetical protein [Anaerolineae bacterium]